MTAKRKLAPLEPAKMFLISFTCVIPEYLPRKTTLRERLLGFFSVLGMDGFKNEILKAEIIEVETGKSLQAKLPEHTTNKAEQRLLARINKEIVNGPENAENFVKAMASWTAKRG